MPDRHAERLRGLRVAEPGDVDPRHHEPLWLGEVGDRLVHALRLDDVGRTGQRAGQHVGVVLDRGPLRLRGAAAQAVEPVVAHGGQQVGELATGLEIARPREQAHADVLDDVLGVVRRPAHRERDLVHHVEVAEEDALVDARPGGGLGERPALQREAGQDWGGGDGGHGRHGRPDHPRFAPWDPPGLAGVRLARPPQRHRDAERAASRRPGTARRRPETAARARPTCRSCTRRPRSPARAPRRRATPPRRRAARPRDRARQRDEDVGDEDPQRRRRRDEHEVGDRPVVVARDDQSTSVSAASTPIAVHGVRQRGCVHASARGSPPSRAIA